MMGLRFPATVLLLLSGAAEAYKALRLANKAKTHPEVPFRRDGQLQIFASGGQQVVTVDLEVPDSYNNFMQGLMYRSSMCDTCSMLFAWDRDGSRPFWMKDTWIPLDLVWVNHEHVIVDIKQAQANDETSVANSQPAQYVFEFSEHWCDRHGVKVGDKVEWQHESDRPEFLAADA
mmetsp:Transcript_105257/g.339527  ORF Transcript_105257/g.339527 Transcript_105257/m.339527 type:complete len:175 (+) Transcript_105257:118-642(+)